MKYYQPFASSGQSFAERVGRPDEDDAAMGLVSITFQELEATISEAIASRLTTDQTTARIVTAGLSFKAQLNLLAAITRHQVGDRDTPDAKLHLDELAELIAVCAQAEDLRNKYVHSFWDPLTSDGHSAVRRKRTAKRHGYREYSERVSAGMLLDVADYLQYVTGLVEQFYDLPLGKASSG